MKAMIDLQSLTAKDVPISSPITLGSRELPYFVTARAFGELSIVDSTGKIEVNNELEYIAKLTAIKYEAFNSYFVHQTYLLEGGGIIVKQPDGKPVMRVDPPISAENKSTINIYYTIPIIVGIAGKDSSTTDYKTCFIRTNYSDRSDVDWIPRASVSGIRITTNYTSAWNESLHDLLGSNVNISKGSNYVEITKKVKQINLYYKEIYIYAQISPGWIE
jgi:hypothetical protein